MTRRELLSTAIAPAVLPAVEAIKDERPLLPERIELLTYDNRRHVHSDELLYCPPIRMNPTYEESGEYLNGMRIVGVMHSDLRMRGYRRHEVILDEENLPFPQIGICGLLESIMRERFEDCSYSVTYHEGGTPSAHRAESRIEKARQR